MPPKFPIFEVPKNLPKMSPVKPPVALQQEISPKVSLYIATPCFGCRLSNGYVQSVLQLQLKCREKGIAMCSDILGSESLITRARNVLTERFLKSTATHLLFIDADIAFAPESVFRLVEAKKPVVGGVYPKKYINWAQVQDKMEKNDQEPMYQYGLDFNINIVGRQARVENGFVQVLDTATGFLLIERDVITKVVAAHPELRCKNDIINETMKIDYYHAIFECMIDPESDRYLSEDYSFCRRWQALGGEIWVDVLSTLSHTGAIIIAGDISKRLQSPAENKVN